MKYCSLIYVNGYEQPGSRHSAPTNTLVSWTKSILQCIHVYFHGLPYIAQNIDDEIV